DGAPFFTASGGVASRYARASAPSPQRAQSDAADAASASQAPLGNGDGTKTKSPDGSGQGFDASVVQAGETAFNRHCTSCHDAQKSLQATKNLAGWRTTVRRMAGKPDAEIPGNVHESIATYLASRNQSASGETAANGGKEAGAAAADAGSPFSFWGTFSPWWRGGGGNAVQDPGFFPGLWIGGTWQGDGPVSARATACTTCHNEAKLDLVEAAVRFDITKYLRSRGCTRPSQSEPEADVAIDAGRFIVPFGAFYQQANPGVYRTVSMPLIYNMGERVFATSLSAGPLGFPVLPMPYADTGANLSLGLPIAENANATFDAYLVNGLQGSSNGVDFVLTRQQYYGNNRPAGGGRVTIGGQHLRLGASVTGGSFNTSAASPTNQVLNYLIFGADATFRWKDRLRVQFEYAQRNSGRVGTVPANIFTERVGGLYLEGELLVSRHWNMSLLARYDSQSTQSLLPPPGSTLTTGSFTVQRFTYGVNWTLPGGSLLMVNEEHWFLPHSLGSVDILGVRWAVTF
ncbi:MAG TPA: hypothetical protein PK867_00190, partial [Pirellulales bacterium]|nr:hypothetical protein [Pirellulales bacterium]